MSDGNQNQDNDTSRWRTKKGDVIFLIVIVVICLTLLFFRLKKEAVINKNGAYVIGVVTSRDEDVYQFRYLYNGKGYIAEIKDLRRFDDTLAFFKISREYPDKWSFVDFTKVPECFSMNDVPQQGWRDMPACDSINQIEKY